MSCQILNLELRNLFFIDAMLGCLFFQLQVDFVRSSVSSYVDMLCVL